MALKDVVEYTREGVKGPLERIEEDRIAREARGLESLKVRSEAFYKQQLGLSEMADRGGDAKSMARLQKAMSEAPKRENYIDPTAPAGEQKQALQNWWRDYSTFMTSNYPDVAKSLDMKPAQTGGAVAEVDVGAKQQGVEAEARRAESEANVNEQGLEAKGIEATDNALWAAENVLKERGKTNLMGSAAEGDVQELATRAMQLQQADGANTPGGASRPMRDYVNQAYEELYGSPQSGQGGMAPPPPPTGFNAPTPMPNQMNNPNLPPSATGGPSVVEQAQQDVQKRRVIDLSQIR